MKFPLLCVHLQGLGEAAHALRKRNIIDSTQPAKLILLDGVYNLLRHITVISSDQFRMSISNNIKVFAGARQTDIVLQTDTAPAPADEYLAPPPAATFAATAALTHVIQHAAPVPSDTLAAPAPVIKSVALHL